MTRPMLSSDHVDAAVREKVTTDFAETVNEVIATVGKEPLVIVGMKANPHVIRARKAMTKANIAFTYLEYGGYTSEWRRRTAIKMWSGWHSFPQVFVKGVLVGGANELVALHESGELQRRLDA